MAVKPKFKIVASNPAPKPRRKRRKPVVNPLAQIDPRLNEIGRVFELTLFGTHGEHSQQTCVRFRTMSAGSLYDQAINMPDETIRYVGMLQEMDGKKWGPWGFGGVDCSQVLFEREIVPEIVVHKDKPSEA